MWRALNKVLSPIIKQEQTLLNAENILHQQQRTTYVLKRKFPTQLHKKNATPKKLRSRHYIYELVQDTTKEKPKEIDIILTSYVDGIGNLGDRVTVKQNFAYNNLILPGFGVYASPENVAKYENYEKSNEEKHSSPNALLTVKTLSRISISVVMNKEMPWTLQKWHVKASFRKSGYIVPEEAITLPEKPISGPDMNIENKEFYVTVKINNTETVNVRCRIHHWSTDIRDRIPHVPKFWNEPGEPIFEEQSTVLNSLPRKPDRETKPLE